MAKKPVSGQEMWGGRFAAKPDQVMEAINASIDVDKRMAVEDITGSRAHVRMLAESGIVAEDDRDAILKGLEQVAAEIEAGDFPFRKDLEDIHMNIEARLKEIIGEPAGRLHTARSRNDQVATDFRLWTRSALETRIAQTEALMGALLDQADLHADTVMPGFTHLQTAQPVTFGHHLMAYVEMFSRDRSRFADAKDRLNESPLGAAALAGTGFPINRQKTAADLGFTAPMANSLDAVSARDFAVETVSACSICATPCRRDCHLGVRSIPLCPLVRCMVDRLFHHAAKAQSGCRRACSRKNRPHLWRASGAADRAERSSARLLQRHAGRQRTYLPCL